MIYALCYSFVINLFHNNDKNETMKTKICVSPKLLTEMLSKIGEQTERNGLLTHFRYG